MFAPKWERARTLFISGAGYPDGQYLNRVKRQLADLGIMQETTESVSNPSLQK